MCPRVRAALRSTGSPDADRRRPGGNRARAWPPRRTTARTACNGAGTVHDTIKFKVKIPAGVDNGGRIRIAGYGEAGEKGAQAGDLYLEIRVKPSDKFERDDYDILTTKEINFSQAALGDKIEVETVQGAVELKIPEGTQSGTVFKLKNKGVPLANGRGNGDHLVTVIVKTPKSLSKKQKEVLKELGI